MKWMENMYIVKEMEEVIFLVKWMENLMAED